MRPARPLAATLEMIVAAAHASDMKGWGKRIAPIRYDRTGKAVKTVRHDRALELARAEQRLADRNTRKNRRKVALARRRASV